MTILTCVLILGADISAFARSIGLFVGDSDAYTCIRAMKIKELPDADIRIFTHRDIDRPDFHAFIQTMDAAVVDIMQRQPAQ